MPALLIRKAVLGGVLHKLDGEAYDFYLRRLLDFYKQNPDLNRKRHSPDSPHERGV